MAGLITWASIESLEQAMGKDAATALAKRLLGFLADKVPELEAAFEKGDNEQIRFCIHKMASNAAALGALELSKAARALETECSEGRWDHVKSQGKTLVGLARDSVAELREKLG